MANSARLLSWLTLGGGRRRRNGDEGFNRSSTLSWLALLLAFKIAFTLATGSAPLLLLPAERLSKLYGVGVEAAPLCRLYGVAITALLVGYASGFAPAAQGIFPWGVVAMGVVSNTGATLALLLTGAYRRARALTFVFAAIALGLIAASFIPQVALLSAF